MYINKVIVGETPPPIKANNQRLSKAKTDEWYTIVHIIQHKLKMVKLLIAFELSSSNLMCK